MLFNVVPVQDERDIYLGWIIPFKSAEDRLTRALGKPQYVVSTLLGHEGKGSLLSYLKNKRGWVTSLGASEFDSLKGTYFWLSISVLAVHVWLSILQLWGTISTLCWQSLKFLVYHVLQILTSMG